MTKEIWRQRWLDAINELTSLDLQKKSWLDRQNTRPHWTFVEFMCSYFDDLLFDGYNYYIDCGWVSRQEYEIIQDWHETLEKYKSPNNDDYDDDAVLNDTKWLHIIQTGADAKNKLSEILQPDEKTFLKEKNY